jgi:hypothetical protein
MVLKNHGATLILTNNKRVHTPSVFILTRKGGEVNWREGKARETLVCKRGRKYQHD